MKTKELIKMLQEEDPEGEGYIRISGGVITGCESKPGYWDGPYSYIDKNKNYCISAADYKVDIYTKDLQDFVHEHTDIHEENNWENIKSKLRFDFSCYANESQAEDKINSYLKSAGEYYGEMAEIEQNHYDRACKEMLDNAEKGWTWFQNKDVDKNEKPNMHVYYTWKVFDEKGKDQGSNIYQTESIQKSGKWVKFDNNKKNGYYEWILKSKLNEM